MNYLILILIVIIFSLDGLPCIKKSQWNEFFTILSLLIISLIFIIFDLANFTSPLMMLNKIISNLVDSIFRTY